MNNNAIKRITLSFILQLLVGTIRSSEFNQRARRNKGDFTRNKKLTFVDVFLIMLSFSKACRQLAINRYFKVSGKLTTKASQQAFSKARAKIGWEACKGLFADLVDAIYSNGYSTWHGFRVLAIDGSKIQLPIDKILRMHFGTAGRNNSSPTAQSSILYDVLNGFIVDAIIGPMKPGERTLAQDHVEALSKLRTFGKELLLLDRGYSSIEMLRFFESKHVKYCMRLKDKFNVGIDKLPMGIHFFTLCDKNGEVTVRIVKFKLDSGAVETLITNLYDDRLSTDAFKKLYFIRWPVETEFRRMKCTLQIENFTGRTVNAICQEFYLAALIANLIGVSVLELQPIIDEAQEEKDNKYSYKINFNYAFGVYRDYLIGIMLAKSKRTQTKLVAQLERELLYKLTPIRSGRSVERKISTRKSKHNHNYKFNG
jgi:hypothetical protein